MKLTILYMTLLFLVSCGNGFDPYPGPLFGADPSYGYQYVSTSALSSGKAHVCALNKVSNSEGIIKNDVDCRLTRNAGLEENFGQVNIKQTNFDDIKQVITGSYHTCLLADGNVTCAGSNSEGQSSVPLNLKNPTELISGEEFSCARHENGLRCWGNFPNYRDWPLTSDHSWENSKEFGAIAAGGSTLCFEYKKEIYCPSVHRDRSTEKRFSTARFKEVRSLKAAGNYVCLEGLKQEDNESEVWCWPASNAHNAIRVSHSTYAGAFDPFMSQGHEQLCVYDRGWAAKCILNVESQEEELWIQQVREYGGHMAMTQSDDFMCYYDGNMIYCEGEGFDITL